MLCFYRTALRIRRDEPALGTADIDALHGPGRDEPSRWRTEVAVGPMEKFAGP